MNEIAPRYGILDWVLVTEPPFNDAKGFVIDYDGCRECKYLVKVLVTGMKMWVTEDCLKELPA